MSEHLPQLPPEILTLIGEQCLEVFTDQELWFSLARVSHLFRKLVERWVTRDKEERGPLCPKCDEGILAQGNRRTRLTCWSGSRLYCALYFTRISSDQPQLAVFTIPPTPKYNINLNEFLQDIQSYIESSAGPGTGGHWREEHLIHSPKEQLNFLSVTEALTSIADEEDNRTHPFDIDCGTPVEAKLIEGEDGPQIAVMFEWRKLYTLLTAPLREIEQRLKDTEYRPPKPRTAVKGAALAKIKEARRERQRNRVSA